MAFKMTKGKYGGVKMEQTDKPNTHGGTRPGAGRKPAHGEPTEVITLRLPASLVAKIDAAAVADETNRNTVCVAALRAANWQRNLK